MKFIIRIQQAFICCSVHFLLIGLGWFLPHHAQAQAYNFNYLTLQDGLPQSQAFAILFDVNEHAWIGTQGGGLCRFDGEQYFYLTKNDSLISNRVYSLAEKGREIWVGQKGGVTVFNLDGKLLANYRTKNTQVLVQDICFFEGIPYFATNLGVYTLMDQQLVPEITNPNLTEVNAFSFFQPDSAALWVCTNEGLLHFTDPFSKLNKARGMRGNQVQCAVKFKDQWVLGTYESGLHFYDTQVYQLEALSDLDDKIILSLYVTENEELWIGTLNHGVYVYNEKEKSLRNFKRANGLSGNHVKTIVADHWGNIWIGTSGGGVSIFQNSPFIAYNSLSGLNGNYVFSVLNDSKNNLWLGTEGTGVLRLNDTSRVLFDEESGFHSEKVKAIFEDRDGDIWFGTEGKGVGVYSAFDRKDTVYAFFHSNGLKASWIRCFAQDQKSGTIYIGTGDAGIYSVNKKRGALSGLSFKQLKVENGKVPRQISALLYDKGKLWFAGVGAYGFIEDKQIEVFQAEGQSFRNIVGERNTIWIGSKDDGILRLELGDTIEQRQWISPGKQPELQSGNIYQLLYHNRQLWVGTEKGLDRLDLDSSNHIIGGEHFGFQEGFEGVETNINAGSVDQEGNLWFGTVDGLFVYKGLNTNPTQRKPPVLRVTDFQIIFESIENTPFEGAYENGTMISPLLLPYDQNHISILFQAVHYSYASAIQYRWRLSGIDPDWTPGTFVNVATYPNLPPGDYTFEVQASIDATWEQAPVTLYFSIDEPYWEKFWFKAGYYSLIILVVIIIVLIILFRQRKKSRELNEKLTLEKNILELEQKALRLQMNPHFIFNVLNSIHNLIILNDSDRARYALSKFSKLMRQVLENSREKLISIDDEIATLQNYVQLERLTSNAAIDLIFDLDDDLDTSEEVLPPLMIQPFVENAIVHGLKGLEVPGEIRVSFKWITETVLECAISDNGIGREKANEIKAQRATYHKSTALKVAQERLANLNQEVSFVPFEIVDLKDSKGSPAGTKVVFRIAVE